MERPASPPTRPRASSARTVPGTLGGGLCLLLALLGAPASQAQSVVFPPPVAIAPSDAFPLVSRTDGAGAGSRDAARRAAGSANLADPAAGGPFAVRTAPPGASAGPYAELRGLVSAVRSAVRSADTRSAGTRASNPDCTARDERTTSGTEPRWWWGGWSLSAAKATARASDAAPRVRGPSHRPDRVDDVGARLRLTTLPERVTLVEGGEEVRVPLSFARGCGEPRSARLSLLGKDGRDERDLSHRFEHEEISGEREGTTLTLSLGIATAPILEHTRELRLRIEEGGTVREVPILVDAKPTEAHDVYLLAGQSNMEGYSESGAKRAGPGEVDEPHPRIRQLNATANSRLVFDERSDFTDESVNVRPPAFTRAEDPLHDPRSSHGGPKRGTYVGPGLSFAKAMLPYTTRDIYLVPAAWGASGFCANLMGDLAWNAEPRTADALGGSLLLERALVRLDMTLRESGGILRGILWHQGGADSNDIRCAERYADNLVRMVERLRREARPDARGESARGARAAIPFVAATMSRGVDERGDYYHQGEPRRIVDAVHRSLAELLPHADFINGDDLVPPAYPCGQNSCVHYGAEANRVQGRRFAEAIRRIADR